MPREGCDKQLEKQSKISDFFLGGNASGGAGKRFRVDSPGEGKCAEPPRQLAEATQTAHCNVKVRPELDEVAVPSSAGLQTSPTSSAGRSAGEDTGPSVLSAVDVIDRPVVYQRRRKRALKPPGVELPGEGQEEGVGASSSRHSPHHSPNTRATTRADERGAPALSAARPKAPRAALQQLYLDLGQANFAYATCPACGLVYACGVAEEERLHQQFHAQALRGVAFQGWRNERVIGQVAGTGERLVLVLPGDPPGHRKKVQEVASLVQQALGLPEGWLLAKHCHVYLVVSDTRRVLAAAFVEPVSLAYRLFVPPSATHAVAVEETGAHEGAALAGASSGTITADASAPAQEGKPAARASSASPHVRPGARAPGGGYADVADASMATGCPCGAASDTSAGTDTAGDGPGPPCDTPDIMAMSECHHRTQGAMPLHEQRDALGTLQLASASPHTTMTTAASHVPHGMPSGGADAPSRLAGSMSDMPGDIVPVPTTPGDITPVGEQAHEPCNDVGAQHPNRSGQPVHAEHADSWHASPVPCMPGDGASGSVDPLGSWEPPPSLDRHLRAGQIQATPAAASPANSTASARAGDRSTAAGASSKPTNPSVMICRKHPQTSAVCGVRALWVHPSRQRRGLGTHLLDAARQLTYWQRPCFASRAYPSLYCTRLHPCRRFPYTAGLFS
eukprot:jgi/Mesvir1/26673/Mv20457-RA.1